MYMIRGSWDMLHLFCGEHGELHELVMESTPRGISYACRERDGKLPCKTKISLEEYEEILSHLSDQIVGAEIKGEVPDLTHTTWKGRKGIICKVLLHQKDRIHVLVDCTRHRR